MSVPCQAAGILLPGSLLAGTAFRGKPGSPGTWGRASPPPPGRPVGEGKQKLDRSLPPLPGAHSARCTPWGLDRVHPRVRPAASEGQMCPSSWAGRLPGAAWCSHLGSQPQSRPPGSQGDPAIPAARLSAEPALTPHFLTLRQKWVDLTRFLTFQTPVFGFCGTPIPNLGWL